MEKLSRSVRRAKQIKFYADCTCPYSPYRTRGRTVQHTWPVHTGHMEAPGRDTCHAFLAFLGYV
jgi:hypothetical protein